jgi:hypothetical protein
VGQKNHCLRKTSSGVFLFCDGGGFMPKMIHSKYGYEPPEYVKADAELEKWLKKEKEKDRNGK